MANITPTHEVCTFPALRDTHFGLSAEEIAEELGGELPRYPRIKIPAGGITAFEMPGDDDDTAMVKSLEGIIVWHHSANAYWANSDAQNALPDCASTDGKWGNGNPGGQCASCPYNEFESGEGGKGKACKNMKMLYLMTRDCVIPFVLSLPPTSIRNFQDYATKLVTKGKKVCDVVTSITLIKKEGGAGQLYSQAVFKMLSDLSPEDRQGARDYRKTLTAFDMMQEYIPEKAAAVNEATGEVIDP